MTRINKVWHNYYYYGHHNHSRTTVWTWCRHDLQTNLLVSISFGAINTLKLFAGDTWQRAAAPQEAGILVEDLLQFHK